MKRTITSLATALGVAATLVACGTTQSNQNSKDADAFTTVKVGTVPVADFFTLYVAQEEGLFEKEGLQVEVSIAPNAASVVPSVLNGQLQFGAAASAPFMIASEKGLPITGVVPNASVPKLPADDNARILVLGNSAIETPTDLEGKTVAVNALNSLAHVAATALISSSGADPRKVNFIAMPFPDMKASLERKRVDAIVEVEPFVSQILHDEKARSIAPLYSNTYPEGTTETLLFASKKFVDSNSEVVAKFTRVLAEATELVTQDPELVRQALVKYGKLSKEAAQQVKLPVFASDFNLSGMQAMADLMVRDGFLAHKIDVQSTIHAGN